MFGSNKFNSVLKHPGYNTPVAIALAGLAVSAVGAIGSYVQGQKAADSAADAEKAKQRMAEVEAQRERIKQVREARIRRAQVVASSQNTGLGGFSSGVAGATSSIASQTASNIGSINQTEAFASQASSALQKSANYQVGAQTWQTIGNAGTSIFNNAGGFTTIFGGNNIKGVK